MYNQYYAKLSLLLPYGLLSKMTNQNLEDEVVVLIDQFPSNILNAFWDQVRKYSIIYMACCHWKVFFPVISIPQ